MATESSIGVGGAWRDMAPGCAVGVGGAWRTIDRMWIGVAGVWRQFYQNVFYGINGGGLGDTPTSTPLGVPATDNVILKVDPNGNIYSEATNDGTVAIDQWVFPASAADTNKWVRWTNTSGAINIGTAGTWQQLTVQRAFGFSYTGLTGTATIVGTLELAADAAGATILGSGSYSLSASVQEFA